MKKSHILCLISVFLVATACQNDQNGAETQFSVDTNVTASDGLLHQILSGKKTIDVCVINESPDKNKRWINDVEIAFSTAIQNWLKAGTRHPKYPLPQKIELRFTSVTSQAFMQAEIDSAKKAERASAGLLKILRGLQIATDQDFPELFEKYVDFDKNLLKENRVIMKGCKKEAVNLIVLSQPAAIKALELAVEKANKFSDSLLTEKEWEELTRKYVRIIFKGKMSYEEFKRKHDESEKNEEYLTRAGAHLSPPSITLQQTAEHEQFLYGLMNHEVGHLFGLGDVYIDSDLQTELKAHPNALMGDHRSPSVQGKIQPDDVNGLMASITFAKTKVKDCGKAHHEFDNTADSRSDHNFYCLPDGFEEAYFDSKKKPHPLSISSHLKPYPASPAACPTGMVSTGASGGCCPAEKPILDPMNLTCGSKK